MLSKFSQSIFKSQTRIDHLLQSANSCYELSIPLLASGLLSDKARFDLCLGKLKPKLEKLENNGFKAWLYGRILLSAKNVNHSSAIQEAKKHIETYLNNNNDLDACGIWSMGYLAALDKKSYAIYKDGLSSSNLQLADKYNSAKLKSELPSQALQNNLSDAIWAMIMNLQAAAQAADKPSYDLIIEQLKNITEQSNLTSALECGLIRTSASNDYPAWALSIAAYSCAVINDEENFQDLIIHTTTSAQNAETENKLEEALLGNLTLSVAEKIWQENRTNTHSLK